MTRIPAALCLCMLVLAGCVHTTKTRFPRHYALGETTATTAGASNPNRSGQRILRVARVSVAPWLVGTAMYYRLDYRDDRSLAAYGQSDWIAPPATLLESMLQQSIAASGSWRAVIGPRNPATADASLRLRLDDFTQAFSDPHDSAGVLDATATLVDDHDGHVMAQRHFRVEVAAPTPDAQGGVKALGEASRTFAAELQHWLHTVNHPGAAAAGARGSGGNRDR